MSFPKITSLAPADEHFDSSAVNEGIWLSEGHIKNVENALVAAAANDTTQAARIQELTQQLADSQTALTTAQASLTTANTKVTGLEAEVVALNKKPAAPLTQTNKEGGDVIPGTEKQLSAVTKEANELRALSGKPPIKA